MSSLRGPHSPQASLKPLRVRGFNNSTLQVPTAWGQKFPKRIYAFKGLNYQGLQGFQGNQRFKDVQGLPHKPLTSKGPFSPNFQGQGSVTSTRTSEFFHDFNFKGFYNVPQRLQIFETFWVKGLEGFVLPVSGGTKTENSKMGIWFYMGSIFQRAPRFQVPKLKAIKGISFTVPNQKTFQSFKRAPQGLEFFNRF